MAGSIPDVELQGVWTDAYAVTSITAGTDLAIQNKSPGSILAWIGADSPAQTSRNGVRILPNDPLFSSGAGENGVWLWGVGPVSIQIND